MFKYKYEIYLLPVLIFIFLYNFHYYGFYKNDFTFNQSIINPDFSKNEYENVMQYHPYSIIYQYAKKFENENNQIYLLLLKKDDKNYDYTSTYLMNVNNKSGKITKVYLSELALFSNYYFYPKKIKPFYELTGKEFAEMNLKVDDIIVTDTEISPTYEKNYNLVRVAIDREGNPLVRINRKMEDVYYLYIVE